MKRTVTAQTVHWFGLLVVALFLTVHLGFAQLPAGTAARVPGSASDFGSIFGKGSSLELPSTGGYFEGAVDSTEYIVGPGDLFRIVYSKPTYNEVMSRVSAEGDLSIPLVGLVRAANLTLAEAKQRVAEAVARSFRYGEVSTSLIEPRKFRVHVSGMVMSPGTYVVSATARVADAIELAGGLSFDLKVSGQDTTRGILASARNILLRNREGAVAGYADLLLFQRSGATVANPMLKDGFAVFVPAAPTSYGMFSVAGAVGVPGKYEFRAGDRVRDAIAVAGGFTSSSDQSRIVLARSSGETELRGDNSLDEKIQVGDRILVAEQPADPYAGTATVEGEVANPGGFAITNGKTTVRELLAMAGGLTGDAVARSARLVRNPEYDPAGKEISRIVAERFGEQAQGPTNQDAGLYAEFTRWEYGTVVLDLSADDGRTVMLNDGDRLVIPQAPLGVRVLGSVVSAGEVPWTEDWVLSDYLSAAGGKSKGAWVHHALVIRAKNGSQVRYSKKLAIDPGDVIYVPHRPYDISAWTTFKDFLTVAAQVATVVLVVQQASK